MPQRAVCVEDLAVASALALLAAIPTTSWAQCRVVVLIAVGVCAAHTLYVLLLRPHPTKIDAVFAVVNAIVLDVNALVAASMVLREASVADNQVLEYTQICTDSLVIVQAVTVSIWVGFKFFRRRAYAALRSTKGTAARRAEAAPGDGGPATGTDQPLLVMMTPMPRATADSSSNDAAHSASSRPEEVGLLASPTAVANPLLASAPIKTPR